MKINSYISVKYFGPDDPIALRTGRVYRARVLKPGKNSEENWFGIIDEDDEEYAYPPTSFEIVSDQEENLHKRFQIIGCPGAGKSTFAEKLHKKTKLPLYHLDQLFLLPEGGVASGRIIRNKVIEITGRNEWIIDGTYLHTLNRRIRDCDTVFFFDLPVEECLEGVKNRIGKPAVGKPFVETKLSKKFRDKIVNYNTTERPELIRLLERYENKEIVTFHSREEADRYLSELE